LNIEQGITNDEVFGLRYSTFQMLSFSFAFLISLNIYAQIESWWIGIGSAVLPVYFIFAGASIFSTNNTIEI